MSRPVMERHSPKWHQKIDKKVERYQKCPTPPLLEELERLLMESCRGFVGWLAARAGLSRDDVEDAQQESFQWLREALQAFKPGRCHFDTFLHRVLMNRFCTWKIQQRATSRVRAKPAGGSGRERFRGPNYHSCPTRREENADWTLERQDDLAKVREVLEGLPPDKRRMADCLCREVSRKTVAEELGISVDALKYRIANFCDELRERLAPLFDELVKRGWLPGPEDDRP